MKTIKKPTHYGNKIDPDIAKKWKAFCKKNTSKIKAYALLENALTQYMHNSEINAN